MGSLKKILNNHGISVVVVGGIALTVFGFGISNQFGSLISGFSNQPLFDSTENFVLFVSEEIKLEQETQISSGDLGSNKNIDIQKDVIVNGNLFADKITLDKNTIINGNVSFNKLQTQKEAEIFGSTTTPVTLPIANLPSIPDFPIGTQDFKFSGATNTLLAGSYRDITLEKNSRLVLNGGIYNLRKLDIRENSIIIFATTTTLNIKEELKTQQKVSILPGANAIFDDVKINFKGTKPIQFGKRVFLNLKLLAPNADVHIGQESTMRGQILAKKIKVEKDSVLSREEVFEKESDPNKVVEDQGIKLIVNEIVALFTDNATFADAQMVAGLVGGIITGFVPNPPTYKFNVSANTPIQLYALLQQIKNAGDPLLIEAVPNIIGEF